MVSCIFVLLSMKRISSFLRKSFRTSLVAQWQWIHLTMRKTEFDPWSRSIPHAAEKLGPRALEPGSRNYWSPCTLEPELCNRSPQWRACTPQLESSLFFSQLEKSPHSNEDSEQSKINKCYIKKKKKKLQSQSKLRPREEKWLAWGNTSFLIKLVLN